MQTLILKIIISVGALGLIGLRIVIPDVTVDATTLGLLIVAVLPWLSTLIKSAEFPGGWKVEFQDVATAGEKVTKSEKPATTDSEVPKPSYLEISDRDPNLALVGLRIEIEKRVRLLAERHGLDPNRPLNRTLGELYQLQVVDESIMGGLKELIFAGNRAAHGAKVDPRAAVWAIEYGPQVLGVLDQVLEG